ncbi:MAG: DUF6567 family protein [Crocinitomicaceae bacterium]
MISVLKFNLTVPTIALMFLLHSCAYYNGSMTGNAAISDANFTVAGFATGTSQSIYVFGIGGLNKDGMVIEAKRNMYTTYPLEPGQAFANVTVDFKRGFYLLFNRTICTITADIIDFNGQANSEDFININSEITKNVTYHLNNFKVGEKIFFCENNTFKPIEATITAFRNGKAEIRFAKTKGNLTHNNVSLSSLYKISNDSALLKIDPIYRIGDTVYFKDESNFQTFRGVIFAIGIEGACITHSTNNEEKVQVVERSYFRTMKNMTAEQNKNNFQGNWKLVSLNDAKVENNSKIPTLNVNAHDLKFSGYGGCNQYFGNYTVSSVDIIIGNIGATRRACVDENIESKYFKALGNQSFKITRTTSTLTLKNDLNSLVFNLIED